MLGLLWPLVTAASIRVRLAAFPTDQVVGGPVRLELDVRSTATTVELLWASGGADWIAVDVPGPVALHQLAATRGVITRIDVRLRVTGPLGIASVVRPVALPLHSPLWIAPAPWPQPWSPRRVEAREVVGSTNRAALVGDEFRSVRPYAPGDPAHLVHGPTSARLGSFVVRELEPPAELGVAIVLNLVGDPLVDEPRASRAAGLLRAAAEIGSRVVLCTHGPTGPRAVELRGSIDAGRQLAEATAGPPGSPPPGWHVEQVDR